MGLSVIPSSAPRTVGVTLLSTHLLYKVCTHICHRDSVYTKCACGGPTKLTAHISMSNRGAITAATAAAATVYSRRGPRRRGRKALKGAIVLCSGPEPSLCRRLCSRSEPSLCRRLCSKSEPSLSRRLELILSVRIRRCRMSSWDSTGARMRTSRATDMKWRSRCSFRRSSPASHDTAPMWRSTWRRLTFRCSGEP